MLPAANPAADVHVTKDQHINPVPSMIRRLSMSGGALNPRGTDVKGQRKGGSLFLAPHFTPAVSKPSAEARSDQRVTQQASTPSDNLAQSYFVTPVRAPQAVSGIVAAAAALQQAGGGTLFFGESPAAFHANAGAGGGDKALRVMAPPSTLGPVSTASASAILISTPSRPSTASAQGKNTWKCMEIL